MFVMHGISGSGRFSRPVRIRVSQWMDIYHGNIGLTHCRGCICIEEKNTLLGKREKNEAVLNSLQVKLRQKEKEREIRAVRSKYRIEG